MLGTTDVKNYLGDSWPNTRLSHSCSVKGLPIILALAIVTTGFLGFTGTLVTTGGLVVAAAASAYVGRLNATKSKMKVENINRCILPGCQLHSLEENCCRN